MIEPVERAPDELEALLRGVPFFRDLERADIARLVGALEPVEARAGMVLFAEGAEADALYLLAHGRVAVTVRTPGGERTLAVLDAPAQFGELGLLLARRTSTASAVTNSRLWKLSRDAFVRLVRERPAVGLSVATSVAELMETRQRALVGAPLPERTRPPLTLEEPPSGRPLRYRLVSAAIAMAVPLVLWGLPAPAALDERSWHVALVALGAAIAWLLEPLPDFAVALAMAGAWGIAGLAPLDVSFRGFATSTWLVALGALALAAAMTRSGLLFRAALELLRAFPATHRGQTLALLSSGVLLTPLVPLAVGRIAAVATLGLELARALGYAARSRGGAALTFAALTGYWYFSSIFLTGLATNFFVLGLLPAADRARFDWLGWLAAALPVGLVGLVGAIGVLFVLFPPERQPLVTAEVVRRQQRALGPPSREELVTAVALAVLVVGLIAQPVLRIETPWLAIGAIAIAMLGGALDRERFRSAIDWGFLVLFGILLGTEGVLRETGLGRALIDTLVGMRAVSPDPGILLLLIAVAVVVVRFVLPSRPTAFLLSLALVPAAAQLGISAWLVGFVVLVTANLWIFPYQGLEYLIVRDATRGEAFTDRQGIAVGAALTAVRLASIAVAIPYWRAMGLLSA